MHIHTAEHNMAARQSFLMQELGKKGLVLRISLEARDAHHW